MERRLTIGVFQPDGGTFLKEELHDGQVACAGSSVQRCGGARPGSGVHVGAVRQQASDRVPVARPRGVVQASVARTVQLVHITMFP